LGFKDASFGERKMEISQRHQDVKEEVDGDIFEVVAG
jgi:hypothetical protein